MHAESNSPQSTARIDTIGHPAAAAPASNQSMLKVALASLIGTVIEFYDYLIYATAAALVFSQVFFPALGEGAGAIASFATLGIAFIARPIGAVIFGHIGDRLGRKRTLITTMTLMGIATIGIGLLPTAGSIGVAAPIALVVLRLLQGLSAGGELAGAILFSAEYAPKRRRGFWSMFANTGSAIAFMLSIGTFFVIDLTMTPENFQSFGWRIPFLLSSVLLLFGLWIRLRLDETPVFAHLKIHGKQDAIPFVDALRHQSREILLGGGVLLMAYALNYMGAAYLINYGTRTLHLDETGVLGAGVLGGLTLATGVILGGTLSDFFGRRRVILTANLAGTIWALGLFPLVGTGSLAAFFIGLCVSTFIAGLAFGVSGSFLTELFETRFRYTAAAIALSLAAIVGGAIPPIVGVTLTASFGANAFSAFLAVLCLVSAICAFALKETSHRDLNDINAPVQS